MCGFSKPHITNIDRSMELLHHHQHCMSKLWTYTILYCLMNQLLFCRKYRYTAYRQLTRWCWGWLGRSVRVVLLACAVNKIRETFPSDTYTGFNFPPPYHRHHNIDQSFENLLLCLVIASSLSGCSKPLLSGGGGWSSHIFGLPLLSRVE